MEIKMPTVDPVIKFAKDGGIDLSCMPIAIKALTALQNARQEEISMLRRSNAPDNLIQLLLRDYDSLVAAQAEIEKFKKYETL